MADAELVRGLRKIMREHRVGEAELVAYGARAGWWDWDMLLDEADAGTVRYICRNWGKVLDALDGPR